MKYLLVVGDGMADFPVAQLNEKTPLEHLAPRGFQAVAGGATGRVRTCPTALAPGSDTAFLTLLGNDTVSVYTGRSPLEAAGMGVAVRPGEAALRMNLVAVEGDCWEEAVMRSHNGGGIEGEEARRLVTDLLLAPEFQARAQACGLKVYPTDTFRHAAVLPEAECDFVLAPPHDIVGREIAGYLPGGACAQSLRALERASFDYLNRHPVNAARRARGQLAANCAWFWGAGTACALENFSAKYGVRGTVISAVPLVKGIARLSGLSAPDFPWATGLLDTDYEGKARAALNALAGESDFALVHVEAPDEMSHDGSLENKLEAIRRINDRVVEPLLREMPSLGDFRLLLMPDHYTLLSTRTHDSTPVPYALYDSRNPGAPAPFSERACARKPVLESGDLLMRMLFER